MKTKIFVYVETYDNKPIEPSLALINYANEIIKDKKREDYTISALIFSENGLNDDEKNYLYSSGADSIFNIVGSSFSPYSLDSQFKALTNVIKIEHPDIMLFSTTDKQKELAPYLATSINAGLTADCTSLDITFDNGMPELLATRPTFGGKLMAQIAFKGYPQMATVREGVSKSNLNHYFDSKEYKKMNFETTLEYHIKTLETYFSPLFESKLDPNSSIIFSVGAGVGTNFQLVEELVSKLQKLGIRASIGASRKAVEKGIVPRELQVGQTGTFVSPDIYVMLGISGAVHHMIAVSGAKKIIAVNTDENAPIATLADIFIKASVDEFILKILNSLPR